MTRWGSSAGIGYGQAFLLVFGFLITSVLIFLFGMWVGSDLAQRQLIEQEPVVRATIPARPSPDAEGGAGPEFYATVREQAIERLQETKPPSPTPPPSTPTPRIVPSATRTPVPTRAQALTRTAAKPSPPPAAGTGQWSVQVGATTDPREALDMTLRLRARGFEAYTVRAPLRGQIWYRVRVGRFQTREEARKLEAQLRRTGEFKGAYVTSQ